MVGDTPLPDRMEEYEAIHLDTLTPNVPVIIRVDGRHFHTFTSQWADEPFDDFLRDAMEHAMLELCKEFSNAKFGYTQSDEINVVLWDNNSYKTMPFFGNKQHKLTSVAASFVTSRFNEYLREEGRDDLLGSNPHFDGRAFSIPGSEVANYFIYRQQDWTRNSIQMAARAHFTQAEIHGLNQSQMQEKLWQEADVNWNDYQARHKRGSVARQVEVTREEMSPEGDVMGHFTRDEWVVDRVPPIFTKDRSYIEDEISPDEEGSGDEEELEINIGTPDFPNKGM